VVMEVSREIILLLPIINGIVSSIDNARGYEIINLGASNLIYLRS
jgi:hypothetical protein